MNEIETIAEGDGWHQFRRRVPGGWIYESEAVSLSGRTSCCCFVPDPDHEWKLALMKDGGKENVDSTDKKIVISEKKIDIVKIGNELHLIIHFLEHDNEYPMTYKLDIPNLRKCLEGIETND